MNERINELFDKALDEVIPNTWTNLTMDQLNDIKNYFAELIVKECVQACINEGKTYAWESAGEYQSNLYASAIKEHFGVEE